MNMVDWYNIGTELDRILYYFILELFCFSKENFTF